MITSLVRKPSAGALIIKFLIKKYDAVRYLPKAVNAFLRFNAAGELISDTNLVTSVDARSGAGAISVETFCTKLSTTGANALTLADGVEGQLKRIVMLVDGGDGTLTPATKTGFSTITFNDVGDSVLLQFHATVGWMIVANNGCTVA